MTFFVCGLFLLGYFILVLACCVLNTYLQQHIGVPLRGLFWIAPVFNIVYALYASIHVIVYLISKRRIHNNG